MKRYVRGDASYLAANDPRAHFGLGKATSIDRIQVYWLAGGCEMWKPEGIDTIMNVREGSGKPCPALSATLGRLPPDPRRQGPE
jgi:hypothetical protein